VFLFFVLFEKKERLTLVCFVCRYSTGSNLNTYSALIQNFYSQETTPYQAIHLSMDTGAQEGEQVGVKAYIRFVPFPLTN